MADNFDLRKYLVENNLGPFAKVKAENKDTVTAYGDSGWVVDIDGKKYQAEYDNHDEGQQIDLENINDSTDIRKGIVTDVTPNGDVTIELKPKSANEGVTAAPMQPTSGDKTDPWTVATNAISSKYKYQIYHDEIDDFLDSKSGQDMLATMKTGEDAIKAYEKFHNLQRESIDEALSAEAIERIEGLVPQRDLALAFQYLDAVAQELDDEGFSQADIANYIHMKVAEYYGKPTM